MRALRDEDVLASMRREVAESRYGHAPGSISFEGLHATLAIAGFTRGAATAAALRASLERLVATGQARTVPVLGPDGEPGDSWYQPAESGG